MEHHLVWNPSSIFNHYGYLIRIPLRMPSSAGIIASPHGPTVCIKPWALQKDQTSASTNSEIGWKQCNPRIFVLSLATPTTIHTYYIKKSILLQTSVSKQEWFKDSNHYMKQMSFNYSKKWFICLLYKITIRNEWLDMANLRYTAKRNSFSELRLSH